MEILDNKLYFKFDEYDVFDSEPIVGIEYYYGLKIKRVVIFNNHTIYKLLQQLNKVDVGDLHDYLTRAFITTSKDRALRTINRKCLKLHDKYYCLQMYYGPTATTRALHFSIDVDKLIRYYPKSVFYNHHPVYEEQSSNIVINILIVLFYAFFIFVTVTYKYGNEVCYLYEEFGPPNGKSDSMYSLYNIIPS